MQETTVSFKTVGCRLNQAETARLRAVFQAAGYRVVPFGAACKVCVIHGCAVTAKADYIVTGDKDLLVLGEFDSIHIVTPAQFLKQLPDFPMLN